MTNLWKHNPNENLTEEELIELKHMTNDEFRQYINDNKDKLKCPPSKYETVACFYCIQCICNAVKLVKEKNVK